MKNNDIIITGAGVISGIGSGLNHFSESLFSGKKRYRNHPLLCENSNDTHQISYLEDQSIIEGICLRQVRKLDRFCLLAMQAFDQAYRQSGLTPTLAQNYGILLGNSTGGWSFVEPQMHSVCVGDLDAISPYIATAWFPTAPQGEISIKYHISGYSKTFSAGTLSSGYALEHAIYLLKKGYLPGVFVGGTESPISPLVYNSYVHTGELSLSGQYKPYHSQADGNLLGEGASILSIERYENCIGRHATPLAKISHCSIGKKLDRAIEECLKVSKKTASQIDVILLDSKALKSLDRAEFTYLNQIFSGISGVHLAASKQLYGNVVSADFAFQSLVAILMLKEQKIPGGLEEIDQFFSDLFPGQVVLKNSLKARLQTVLTYSIDSSTGLSAAAIFEKI